MSAARVAIVTGASRGVGKGIALGLGEAGWTVYLTSRTADDGDSERPGSGPVTARERPGSGPVTARELAALGGIGIAVRCDHASDADTARLFDRVWSDQGRLDLLVNSATAYTTEVGPPEDRPFWEQPQEVWDLMHTVGLRSHFVASAHAARLMIGQGRGLIVNVSSIGAIRYTGHVSYNVVKAGVDMLTLATAEELRDHDVAVVSIWPRLTRTEGVLRHPELFPNAAQAWTPLFNGRVVAALAADPEVMAKSGQAFEIAALAHEYGVDDVDGRRPALRSVERQTSVTPRDGQPTH